MLDSISYLHIRPIEVYTGSGSCKTTITKFEDILKEKKAAKKTKKETEKPQKIIIEKDTSEPKDTKEAQLVYKDPLSGKKVIYQDVAKSQTVSNSTRSSQTKKTTTVDSMKVTKYDEYFKEAARKYQVSESLLKAIAKAESDFNPNDVSSAGAMGVMQLMPATAKELGVSNPFDPRQNILGGAKCIAQKLKEFNGNVSLALAAYNAGSGAVKRNGGVPSYCKSYISKVLSYKKAFETAAAVG